MRTLYDSLFHCMFFLIFFLDTFLLPVTVFRVYLIYFMLEDETKSIRNCIGLAGSDQTFSYKNCTFHIIYFLLRDVSFFKSVYTLLVLLLTYEVVYSIYSPN